MSGWAMPRTCAECPWLRASPVGRFPPERYAALRDTCRSGGLWPIFACHKTPDGQERACAGFLIVHGANSNRARLAVSTGAYDPRAITATGPLYKNFHALARANGFDPPVDDDDQQFLKYLGYG